MPARQGGQHSAGWQCALGAGDPPGDPAGAASGGLTRFCFQGRLMASFLYLSRESDDASIIRLVVLLGGHFYPLEQDHEPTGAQLVRVTYVRGQ